MSRTPLHRLLPLLALATLGACSQMDPFTREGIWKPSGVNEANMAAMVADPTELWYGRQATQGTFRTSTRAVDRLWVGTPTTGSQARPGQGGFGAGMGGGGAGGAGPGSEATR